MCFNGGDPEILDLREEKGPGGAVVGQEPPVVDLAGEGDVPAEPVACLDPSGMGPQAGFVGAGADDCQRAAGDAGGLDTQFNAFVGLQGGYQQQ